MRIHSAALRAARRLLAAGLFVATTGLAVAASTDGVWQDIDESAIARSTAARQIVPLEFRTVSINRVQLDRVLSAIPMERDISVRDSAARLTLPLPDGDFATFRVVESPIMEPELAARYPQIRTWVGEGIDDPSATVRFDVTQKGFHAQILSADGTSYVDPFQPGDTENYIAYRKQDHFRDRPLQCSVTGDAIDKHDGVKNDGHAQSPTSAARPKVSSGANLRTYRLAMAATGEYTQALGGTVADGLAGIVTTMNRVNGIYERELSVRMVLVANTDLVIFTDGGTDPYTNEDGAAMLDENLAELNDTIGSANYDVGHVVSTGGGGIAQLASVCGGGKARGVTGLPNPTTDQFDVDFVAHEMGHQFNGSHTFNGNGGNCSGGNRSATNAYETGSGVTIQAYAGICGGDNLQPNSEDYFHRQSLNTMLSFTTNAGSGGSCGTLTATGNAIPVVTATASYTIPASTPFELDASATDGDDVAANLTYIWEQFDLGARNGTGVLIDDGGPLFRSFAPRRESSRIFPSLRYILNNGNVAPATAPIQGTTTPNFFAAELLPSTNRTMNFRVTVRDNRAAGGGTNEANTAVTVVAASGPFTVTAPNTAVTWAAGTSENVTWNVASTDLAPINAANVRILLSLDGGFTWPIELAASEPNDGSATVAIPANIAASTQARVRVQAVGNVFFDVSNVNFTVTGTNSPPTISGIVLPVLATRQGSPTATVNNIATIADSTDAAADLTVAIAGAPPELNVSVVNNNGTVAMSATASCTLVAIGAANKSFPMQLQATDLGGAMSSAEVVVRVGANQTPTLGTYGAASVARSTTTPFAPSAGPADANGNYFDISVTPTTLPGGGTVAVAANGTLTVTTTAGTTYGTYPIRVSAVDTCGATETKELTLTVAPTTPVLSISASALPTGNGLIEPNECNALNITLTNTGTVTATGISGTLSTTSTGITVTQAVAAFPDIPPGQSSTSLTPFELSTDSTAVCYSNAELDLTLTYGGGGSPALATLDLPIGEAESDNYVFQSTTGATIPAGGVLVAGSNVDDGIVNLTAPFAFVLYEAPVAAGSTLRATTNGAIQIGAAGGSREYENGNLPAGASANYPGDAFPASAPTLFPYWNDLIMTQANAGIFQQTIGTAPNRQWIVEWRAQEWNSAPTTVNTIFAVVFTEGVEGFEFLYTQTGGAEPNGTGSTIGAQAASTGTVFTQFSRNTASVSAGTRLIATRPLGSCVNGTGACGAVGPAIFGDGFEETP
jgi:hypothetical protein